MFHTCKQSHAISFVSEIEGAPLHAMINTLQAKLKGYTFHSLFLSLQACLLIVMDTLSEPFLPSTSNPISSESTTASARWTENEVTDLVNFLYEHRSEATAGNFKTSTYNRLKEYLDKRSHKTPWTREAIISKFRSVRGSYLDFYFLTYSYIA